MAQTIIKLQEVIILSSFRGAYWVVHRRCFSNVYLYSTLTTNAASVSNYNHDVNLFLVMAYWLPSFIPRSIIFWRLLLGIWWYDFSSQSEQQVLRHRKLDHKKKIRWNCILFPTSTCFPHALFMFLHYFIHRTITSPEMDWNALFFVDLANCRDKCQYTLTAKNSKWLALHKTL